MKSPGTARKAGRSAKTEPVLVRLANVGVRYRFLTERDTTLKGRILTGLAFSGRRTSADLWALRNVNLEFSRGDIVGVVGSNGSGKSTLLRVIAGVIPPTEGELAVAGAVRPLLDVSGFMNPQLTGRANCFLYGALNRTGSSAMSQQIPKIVEFAELGAFFDAPVKCYSSGMVARLAFSMATQIQPEILLIDELLAVGDERFQKKSHFRIMRLIERGSLVVVVSHSLSFVEQVCTNAVLLTGGKVAASGEAREIVARYRREFA